MAQIFGSYFMQSEFKNLYQTLLPNLNECGNCRITKCYFCVKFDASCQSCRIQRCKNCIKFFNAIEFFYGQATKKQWDYICNFLHDLFRVHRITKSSFKDIEKPIKSSVKNSCFIVSSNNVNNSIKVKKNTAIYYMLGVHKYKCFYSDR